MNIKKRPLFIAIDGVDGTGKSTQVELLAESMRTSGREVVATKEPGGTAAGHFIRSILLNQHMMLEPNTELLLFCADRAEHQGKIGMFLNENCSVITDRFLPSTWAYQIFGRKLDPTILEKVIPETVKIFPDLTIILDMDADVSVARAVARLTAQGKMVEEGRFEAEHRDFFADVQKGFRWYAESSPYGACALVDASGDIQQTFHKILAECQKIDGF